MWHTSIVYNSYDLPNSTHHECHTLILIGYHMKLEWQVTFLWNLTYHSWLTMSAIHTWLAIVAWYNDWPKIFYFSCGLTHMSCYICMTTFILYMFFSALSWPLNTSRWYHENRCLTHSTTTFNITCSSKHVNTDWHRWTLTTCSRFLILDMRPK